MVVAIRFAYYPAGFSLVVAYIHTVLALSLQYGTLPLTAFLWDICERLGSVNLVRASITAVVGLLQRWNTTFNGESVAMLFAMVLHVCLCIFFGWKLSGLEDWKGHHGEGGIV
jgi:hypothetical protein